jgi:hypothetical protein
LATASAEVSEKKKIIRDESTGIAAGGESASGSRALPIVQVMLLSFLVFI